MDKEIHSSPFISIQDCVKSFLNEKGYSIDENYKRFLKMAVEGLSEHNIFYGRSIRRHSGSASSANVMAYPTDAVDILRVGIVENGNFRPISPKDRVWIDEKTVEFDYQVDSKLAQQNPIPVGTWFTIGGGWNDVYYHDEKSERILIFDGFVQNKTIGMYYVSSGIRVDGATMVPRTVLTIVKNYLEWILRKRNDNMAENKVQSALRDYNNSVYRFISHENAITPEEYYHIRRGGRSMGPKP